VYFKATLTTEIFVEAQDEGEAKVIAADKFDQLVGRGLEAAPYDFKPVEISKEEYDANKDQE
jgi:hypothetical protein